MDQIDINLFDAWNRIGEACRIDRVEALKRCRRQFRPALRRPPRAWCLVIRAADTRITSDDAFYEEECGKYHEAHDLLLTGELIAKLTRPVFIPWPGVPTWEAAKRLGVSHHFAWLLARKGHLTIDRYDYGGMHGLKCKPIPIVYTPTEVDPNQFKLRTPDAMWGELWKWKHEKIPADFLQPARRVPRMLVRKGLVVFRGWDWICPGRLGANGEFLGCGRRCKYLYAPLPMWTLAKATGTDWALEMPEDSGLRGCWSPGLSGGQDVEIGQGNRTFACKVCWDVWNSTLSNYKGWNDFVSYVSGGLLYGHEVERPLKEVPIARKRRTWKRKSKPQPPGKGETIVEAVA